MTATEIQTLHRRA